MHNLALILFQTRLALASLVQITKQRSWLVVSNYVAELLLCIRCSEMSSLLLLQIFTFTKLSRQCFNCHTFATAQPLIKSSASGVHEGYSLFFNWLHENSIPKIGCDYFWPGLIDLGNNTLPKLASWKLIKV